MKEVNRQQVIDCLEQVGLRAGDGALVHSALQFLGRPQDGVGMYFDALDAVLGLQTDSPAGTLAAPVFNFSFARGEAYDPAAAPAMGMGAFSEWVRQHPEARRTPHPMQSFSLIGKYAAALAALDTPSAFDDGSAVDRMLDLDFKIVLLGADIQAVSLLHYSEQRVGVPYRYWKNFSGKVRRAGSWQEAVYRMYVRDMAIDARLEIHEIQTTLAARGLWRSASLNYGQISACRMCDFVETASDLLSADPWRFVTNRPRGER
jgi:aminoglycoside 3-N-acetyltransferase